MLMLEEVPIGLRAEAVIVAAGFAVTRISANPSLKVPLSPARFCAAGLFRARSAQPTARARR